MIFELLSSVPEVARAFRRLADQNGVSFEVVIDNITATGYKDAGEPIPPDLRRRLLRQARTMTPEQREKYIKPFVN